MLDVREVKILSLIVELYIQTGDPVGSRVLSKAKGVDLSPATLRNVMSDLSDKGLISQPHTSAGRIPTDKGYRQYIAQLKKPSKKTKQMVEGISGQFTDFSTKLEEKLRDTIHMLADITQLTGLATTPKPARSRLKMVKFLCIDPNQVLAVLISQAGMVTHKTIDTKDTFSQESLNTIGSYLNNRFYNQTFRNIRENLMEALQENDDTFTEQLAQTIRFSKRVFDLTDSGELYLYGQSNMLDFPEFEDKISLINLYQVLEEKSEIIQILNRNIHADGIQISIGQENVCERLDHCSIISATYGTSDHQLGSVGVIGPTRMNYEQVIPVIEHTATVLTGELSNNIAS